MSTITTRTPEETAQLAAAYMRRDLASLQALAATTGLDPSGKKAAIVGRIVARSAKIEQPPKAFDFSGLTAPRLNVQF